MFSYYGSKSKIIKEYPSPIYNTIIEPFAGSARYSLLHGEGHRVILNDKYKVIYDIWNYLIHEATEESILNLPDMELGDSIKDLDISLFNLCDAEKYLLGFCMSMGNISPRNTYTTWAFKNTEIQRMKKRVIDYLNLIKKWKITNKDYTELFNIKATWFIDPPYEDAGGKYKINKTSKIDYVKLAYWCRSLRGQVIVCENVYGDWLDFKPLVAMHSNKKFSIETMWYQHQI